MFSGMSQQEQSADKSEEVKIKPNWSPYELKLGANAIKGGRSLFNGNYSGMEIQAALALYRAICVVEFGQEENSRGENFDYQNKGIFYRLGGDWNFIKDQESGNVLSLGLRYANAGFEDNLSYTDDLGFGETTLSYANHDLKARWWEVALSLRGHLVSNLYMGFTMRWQTLRKIKGEGSLKTFDVPGFGKTRRDNSTAFDYYFMWRIPFKKKQKSL